MVGGQARQEEVCRQAGGGVQQVASSGGEAARWEGGDVHVATRLQVWPLLLLLEH